MTGTDNEKPEALGVQEVKDPTTKEKNWLFNCRKCKSLKVEKELILIKFTLFCWYGAGSILQMFLSLYFKQLGISISQMSIMFIFAPPIQLLGPLISGIIADKIGRSKPVLLVNITLTLILVNAMLLVPKINKTYCMNDNLTLSCTDAMENNTFSTDQRINSSNPISRYCDGICMHPQYDLLQNAHNSSTSLTPFSTKYIRSLSEDTTKHQLIHPNANISWCAENILCKLKCQFQTSEVCSDNTSFVFIVSLLLLIFFNCTFSNCYRFLDVTTMSLIKIHNADFGKQRFWSLLSIIIMNPIAGYLIKITTSEGELPNYSAAFYVFDVLAIIVAISAMKLKVQINPPGKSMWRKTVKLLKDIDVLMFAISLLILGSCWAFIKFYSSLYLDELHASSFMISLLSSVNCLCGLPFLWVSDWWIKKFGSNNIMTFALLAYMIQSITYSFLVNPWYALLCETLGIFTIHILWVNVVRHSHEIAPEGLTASVISSAGGLHFGIGKGTGSLIGLIMGKYGGRVAYRFVGVMCAVSSIILMVYEYLRYKSRNKKLEKKKEDAKP